MRQEADRESEQGAGDVGRHQSGPEGGSNF